MFFDKVDDWSDDRIAPKISKKLLFAELVLCTILQNVISMISWQLKVYVPIWVNAGE